MNSDIIKGEWTKLKGSVREKWGELTNDEVDQVNGEAERLIGTLQAKYGYARDKAEKQVDDWLSSNKS